MRASDFRMRECVYGYTCGCVRACVRMDASFGCCPRGDIDGSVVGILL